MTSDLTSRYGAPRRGSRVALVAAATVVTVVFLSWLVWAAWFHGNPTVESELASYKVEGVHEATAVVTVQLADDAERPRCRVRAMAQDHATVGEVVFTPENGRNTVSLRTEREANSVDLVGCTAADQPRAQ